MWGRLLRAYPDIGGNKVFHPHLADRHEDVSPHGGRRAIASCLPAQSSGLRR